MAKNGKSAAAKKAGAKSKKPAQSTADAPMLIPPSRDMKHHITMCELAKAKLDKANGELRNCYKTAESAGCDPAVIRATLTAKKKPAATLKAYYAQLSIAFQETGMPVQFNVHEPKNKDAAAEATVKGTADATAGKPRQHAYVPDSDAAIAYGKAYDAVEFDRVPGMTPAARKKLRDEAANTQAQAAAH